MTAITNELMYEILKQLQTGQSDLHNGQAETNRKIGVLAENFNYMRQDIHNIREDIQKLRSDVHIIALAVDEHTHRLNALEKAAPPLHS